MTPVLAENFKTTSLSMDPGGEHITKILEAALKAVDPYIMTKRHIKREGSKLYIADRAYNLDEIQRVLLIGIGKASIPMGSAATEILGSLISRGVIITKEGQVEAVEHNLFPNITIAEAGHPIPNEKSLIATELVVELLEDTHPQDLVLFLISGGGSALLSAPVSGISLKSIQALTNELLASGATIREINTLRKHLSRVKGGRLAQLAAPATMVTLILSDVVGDPMDVIASGPTVPDSSTFGQAMQILGKYDLLDAVSTDIIEHLKLGVNGEVPETPNPGNPMFQKTHQLIIANNYTAAQAATQYAKSNGFNTLLLTTYLQCEARQAGVFLAALARQIATTDQPVPRPACVVTGGETTVTLAGDGLGGRNQELALGAVQELTGLSRVLLVTLATDGDDGPTDAAGAVVTGETLSRAKDMSMNPLDFLNRNDSYHFFDPLGDLIKTGPTHTNVNDLAFIFAY